MPFRRFLKKFGPGVITGASDDDPSGIGTYSQAGAGFGFAFLWTMLWTVPLMIAIQELSARIAIVSGKGLVRVMRERHGRAVVSALVLFFVIANTINIGADLGAMASAADLVLPRLHFAAWLILFTGVSLALEIFITYKTYAKYLKWLTLTLFSYVIVAFAIHVPWLQALRVTLLPHITISKDVLLMLLALLGTTISPYLFVWQANQELEEERSRHEAKGPHLPPEKLHRDISNMRFDVFSGMIFSNVIAWFIILTAGLVLYQAGVRDIQTADQAARVLSPLAGRFTSMLFAAGIVGTGLLAIPILSGSAAYAVSELFGFRAGLAEKWWQAKGFYGVIIVSMVVGMLMNALGLSPIKALIYAAVGNGLVAPPLIFMLVRTGSDPAVMGQHRSGSLSRILGWLTFVVMTLVPVAWIALSLR